MRIVGGLAGGRRISAPRGTATRPTSDRAREGLFSTVASLIELAGADVLDLYAGSGALGLEALSRGAATAVFVECDPRALRVLRANVEALGMVGAVVRAERVERVLAGPPPERAFDLVLLDPPYGDGVEGVLAALVPAWAGGVVVVERAAQGPAVSWPSGLSAVKVRRYGDTMLWYGQRS
ncbi:MAG: 16S rRNA (guanine(966)-N(2))-methyltransferase RsmD [Frankiaceae bacterium]